MIDCYCPGCPVRVKGFSPSSADRVRLQGSMPASPACLTTVKVVLTQ